MFPRENFSERKKAASPSELQMVAGEGTPGLQLCIGVLGVNHLRRQVLEGVLPLQVRQTGKADKPTSD